MNTVLKMNRSLSKSAVMLDTDMAVFGMQGSHGECCR